MDSAQELWQELLLIDTGTVVAVMAPFLALLIAASASVAYVLNKKQKYAAAGTLMFFGIMWACGFLYMLADYVVPISTERTVSPFWLLAVLLLALVTAFSAKCAVSDVTRRLGTSAFVGLSVFSGCLFLLTLVVPLYMEVL